VVTQQGVIVGEAPVVRFGGAADLIEEVVVGYLRRLGALRSANSSSKRGMHKVNSNVEDEDSWGEEEDEQEQDGSTPACEQCGRRYPHQHVRAVYSTPQPDSSDEEEENVT